jgi:hypothetical protein
MSNDEIVEVVYGKHHKYTVIRKPGGVFTSTEYWIRRDGKPHKGPYKSLRDAVAAAHAES